MKTYEVARDDEMNIRFTGELIASSESCPDQGHPSYSGKTGRWEEFSIYRTKGGKHVCEKFLGTEWQGERHQRFARICVTDDEVVEFFGANRFAKELYEEAGIDCVELVD